MLLDCTLRDGGYYTNWEYSLELLKDLINFHYKYVDIAFEFGYLNLNKEKEFKGLCAESPFEYCSYLLEEFTGKKYWPNGKFVFIMINSNELIETNIDQKLQIIKCIEKNNFFNGVRIATDKNHFQDVLEFIQLAKKNNICSIVNFMKIDKVNDSEIDKIINQLLIINKKYRPDVFYLADSFGSLFVKDTKLLVNLFYEKLKDLDIEIGFHAHNNKGLALANTLEATNNGAQWFDGSWLGMGRGAGNAELEHLILNTLLEGKSIKFKSEIGSDSQELIEKHFLSLKNEYKWGKNIFYDLSSTAGLHPTKCLDLINTHKLSKYSKIYSILSSAVPKIKKDRDLPQFNKNLLKDYLNLTPILVYSGESAINNISGLNFLSESKKYFLIRVNYSSILDNLRTKFMLTSSTQRLIQFLAESNRFSKNLLCISPEYCLKEISLDTNCENLIMHKSKRNYKYSIHFALDLISEIGFKKVKVIGLDGKRNLSLKDKLEHKDTQEIIKKFSNILSIESLASTPYDLKMTPIYSIMK